MSIAIQKWFVCRLKSVNLIIPNYWHGLFCIFFLFSLSLCPQTRRQTTRRPSSQLSAHRYQSTFTKTALAVQVELVTGTAHCSASRSSLRTCGTLLWWRAGIHLCCCRSLCLVSHQITKDLSKSKTVKIMICLALFINRWHAWTTPRWRAPPSDIIYQPPRGTPLTAHLSASFLLHFLIIVLIVIIVIIIIMLLFRSQRAEEERRQEEVSLQFPGCLHGDQPSGDGHLCLHVLCVLHCHHCPVK